MTPTSRFPLVAVALGALLLLGTTACGSGDGGTASAAVADTDAGSIRIQDATIDWPANPSQAAVRMVVVNGTRTDDALLSVSSPVADRATIHRTDTDDQGRSVMTAEPEVPVPAESEVTFAPGGLHVMLDPLTADLQVGDEVDLTLEFEHAGTIRAKAEVIEPGSAGDDTGAAHDH